MELSRAFELIGDLKEEYCTLLERACNIESNSRDFQEIRQVGELFCAFALERGFLVRKEEYPGAGACYIIEMNLEAAASPVMVSGHMDTVYDKGAFGFPPCRREGDILYGPGTADCKGGIAVALLAMDALKRSGFDSRPVKLFLQCDEEVGSRYSGRRSIEFMLREAKGCRAFLNCENARPGKITLMRKGILKTVIEVRGKAAHAKDYLDGASAVAEAAYKIVRLHEAASACGPSFNCTLEPAHQPSNAVADLCRIIIDSRVSSMEEAKKTAAFIRETAQSCTVPGTSGAVIREGMRPPMEFSKRNADLFAQINEICVRCGLKAFEAYTSAGGADASNVSQAGVPTVDSMGIEGADYHTLNERAFLSSMPVRAKVLAAVIFGLEG